MACGSCGKSSVKKVRTLGQKNTGTRQTGGQKRSVSFAPVQKRRSATTRRTRVLGR